MQHREEKYTVLVNKRISRLRNSFLGKILECFVEFNFVGSKGICILIDRFFFFPLISFFTYKKKYALIFTVFNKYRLYNKYSYDHDIERVNIYTLR